MTNEVAWRRIRGFEGYIISENGEIESCWKRGRYPEKISRWVRLKPRRHTAGYGYVLLSRDGQEFRKYIHHLVLETFVGPCPEGMLCRHLNGNPSDNRLCNLQWGTYKENAHDSKMHGTLMQGATHYAAKLTAENVKEVKRLYAEGKLTQKAIGAMFGIKQASVSDIVRGRNWKSVTVQADGFKVSSIG